MKGEMKKTIMASCTIEAKASLPIITSLLTFGNSHDLLEVLARRVDDDGHGADQVEEENGLGGDLCRPLREAEDDVLVDAVAQREVADGGHRGVDHKQD